MRSQILEHGLSDYHFKENEGLKETLDLAVESIEIFLEEM